MFRRSTAILAGVTVFAIMAATTTSAGAEDPTLKSYAAGAYATALELTLLGQDIAVSTTNSAINSSPRAAADGAALLLAGTAVPGAAPSSAPGGKASNNVCAVDIDLAELTGGAISLAEAGLACVETAAVAAPGETVATSASGELVINVLAPGGTVLEPILTPLFDAVTSVTDPLIKALEPLLGVVKDLTDIDLGAVLNGLLDDLQDESIAIAQIAVAPTASVTSATTVEGVLAQAGASGATIRVLPGLAPSLLALGLDVPALTKPLLTVNVGRSSVSIERDPITAEPTVKAGAALATIETASVLGIIEQLTGVVTDLLTNISINLLGCNENNPLAALICIDLGVVNELDQAELAERNLDFGEGTVGREASAATIRVLPIAAEALGGDVLGLRLATSGAAAQAVPADNAPPTTQAQRKPLPKTGGAPLAPLGLALLAGAATTLVLLRRSQEA